MNFFVFSPIMKRMWLFTVNATVLLQFTHRANAITIGRRIVTNSYNFIQKSEDML